MSERNEIGNATAHHDGPSIARRNLLKLTGVGIAAIGAGGPFHARGFDLALGNGQVEVEANGERVRIPAVAEPVGYRVTPQRTHVLSESERPTCT
jgi:hypothetical protein